jgi:hypothetical protein
VLPSL